MMIRAQCLFSLYRLLRTFILIDAAEGINSNDRIGLDMLEEFMIPYVVSGFVCCRYILSCQPKVTVT